MSISLKFRHWTFYEFKKNWNEIKMKDLRWKKNSWESFSICDFIYLYDQWEKRMLCQVLCRSRVNQSNSIYNIYYVKWAYNDV